MYFERKAYGQLSYWKDNYADKYALLIEGPRRVGKTTLVEQFAQNEYRSHIRIDFSKESDEAVKCFDDVSDPDFFFLRLQTLTGVDLIAHESVIILDNVEYSPKARQAVKQLIKDGRYHYIETGAAASVKKNVKGVRIPAEEIKIQLFPMDYQEFCIAAGINYDILEDVFRTGKPIGPEVGRKLMRDLRLYMAVGGMPQAVAAYIEGKNFTTIDRIKREILSLYEEDFGAIDPSGRMSAMYHSIPEQLSRDGKKYLISKATGKRKASGDEAVLRDLIATNTVLVSYDTTVTKDRLFFAKDESSYKLYVADIGLMVTMLIADSPSEENDVYATLLSDKLPANMGYLYENFVAQMIKASGRDLFYHTWEKQESTHYYEIDFLVTKGAKVCPIEVTPSGTGKHESMTAFKQTYSENVGESYILSQKDIGEEDEIQFFPIYLEPFIVS